MDAGHHFEMEVPEVDKAYRHVAYEGGFLFRPCPKDHPTFLKSTNIYANGEKLLLVSKLYYAMPLVSNGVHCCHGT
jgi:hypothetical protein